MEGGTGEVEGGTGEVEGGKEGEDHSMGVCGGNVRSMWDDVACKATS